MNVRAVFLFVGIAFAYSLKAYSYSPLKLMIKSSVEKLTKDRLYSLEVRFHNTSQTPVEITMMSCSYWEHFTSTSRYISLDGSARDSIGPDGKKEIIYAACGRNFPRKMAVPKEKDLILPFKIKFSKEDSTAGKYPLKVTFLEYGENTLVLTLTSNEIL